MLDKDLKALSNFDKDELWADINRKANRKRNYFKIRIISSVAASIALLVFSGIYFFSGQNIKKDQIAIVSAPGPKLITSSGKTINLTKSITDNTIVADNLAIKYNDKVVYTDTNKLIADKFNELIIPRGSEFKLILSDNTVVWLNSGSQIKYPTSFNGKERKVILKGEAYFNVTKNAKKPFVVGCGDFNVKVLGTKFNVSNYSDDDFSHVTLESGKVEVNKGKDRKILIPSSQAYITKKDFYVRNVNIRNFISWRGANFTFHQEELGNIMKRLARWYDIEIFYQNTSIKDIRLTGRVSKYSSLEEVMALLKKVSTIDYKINKKSIVISSANE